MSCECGYKKDVLTGEGLSARNLNRIRLTFGGGDLSGFDDALADGSLDYSMRMTPAYCPKCNDIITATVLRYNDNGRDILLQKPCPVCGGGIELKGSDKCPKCGKPLKEERTGLWD